MAKRGEIHDRIGRDVPERHLRSELMEMVADGVLEAIGERGGRHYGLTKKA